MDRCPPDTERELVNIETPEMVAPPRVEVMFPELLEVVQPDLFSLEVSCIGLRFLNNYSGEISTYTYKYKTIQMSFG